VKNQTAFVIVVEAGHITVSGYAKVSLWISLVKTMTSFFRSISNALFLLAAVAAAQGPSDGETRTVG
jgi:hypothetical protein